MDLKKLINEINRSRGDRDCYVFLQKDGNECLKDLEIIYD